MADLKLVYAAPTEETALNELELGNTVNLFQVSRSCKTVDLYHQCN